jgi:hypothetical protein
MQMERSEGIGIEKVDHPPLALMYPLQNEKRTKKTASMDGHTPSESNPSSHILVHPKEGMTAPTEKPNHAMRAVHKNLDSHQTVTQATGKTHLVSLNTNLDGPRPDVFFLLSSLFHASLILLSL